ncbi:MAG: PilC/PilY family type IV pilus protein [Betaproteobacteria bacterium]|nr:PilC/PilY family type IV pilus protein [Betaproteobacteria bacterium]
MCNHGMPGIHSPLNTLTLACLPILFALGISPARAQIAFPSVPLNDSQTSPPLVMLIASKEHKQFTAAYNDTTDINSVGSVGFKPEVVYYGLFDSKLCYQGKGRNEMTRAIPYTGRPSSSSSYSHNRTEANADRFDPVEPVGDMKTHKCRSGSKLWSGNFLNYVTTSNMDALRKVLYGGLRVVDTNSTTILRRAYIPRDGHAWGKEYANSEAYDIADYTPFSRPKSGERHFFGNYSRPANCGPGLSGAVRCRDTAAPILHVALNVGADDVGNPYRIWDWADADITELFDDQKVKAQESKNFVMQVKVCSIPIKMPDSTEEYWGDNCKPYTDNRGNVISHKPVGVLQKFGEDGSVLFGLFTGSYDYNISGGELRRRAQPFSDELASTGGRFRLDATGGSNGISYLLNRMMVRGFGYGSTPEYRNLRSTNTNTGSGSRLAHRVMKDLEFVDWGNPIGEAMYETLRYLSGAGKATPEFTKASDIDIELLPTLPSWDSPYGKRPSHEDYVPWCSRPNILILSDTSTSFDSDQLPGASFQSCTDTDARTALTTSAACARMGNSFTGTFSDFNAKNLLKEISNKEGIGGGKKYFIGQSGNSLDWAPTAKAVDSLAEVRGLPEDPAKEGSYTVAAVARYGKQKGITTVPGKNKVDVDTWAVALASSLPEIKVNGITIVPFGKSVAGGGLKFDARKNYFQPTNQIVKFYVKHLSKKPYDATFLISYNSLEQGGDYSMDFLVEYRVRETVKGNVEVTVTPKHFATDITMNVGYVVSGAGEQDGPYLVVQNRSKSLDNKFIYLAEHPAYHLNVPPDMPVGHCADVDTDSKKAAECAILPACTSSNSASGTCTLLDKDFQLQHSKRTFTPSGIAPAERLPNPLWLAAKYGSYRTKLGDWPSSYEKWDTDEDGIPDNYFPVSNAAQLEKALINAINNIREVGGRSSGRINTSSDVLSSSETLVFSTTLSADPDLPDWGGNLVARLITANGLGDVRWRAAEELPEPDNRRIFTRKNYNIEEVKSKGAEFKWENNLNEDQKTALGALGQRFNGKDVLNFVRGSNEKEIKNNGNFRDRIREKNAASPLGGSPNNTPRYFKPTSTIYLGANDGMLHAYHAETGKELFAYIPSALIPKLPSLASPSFGHDWYVDGEIAIGTIQQGDGSSTHWLVGGLGRGGAGLYGLDVSDPANFSKNNVAWELNGTPFGECANKNPDLDNLGVILGTPLIGKFNDGNTYAIVGNGYNSCGTKTSSSSVSYARAILYVIDIQTGKVVSRITTDTTNGNGLSTPTGVDLDGNGTIDIVYAGDLNGNLWRFDMRSNKPADWKARLGNTFNTATPLLVARSKNTPAATSRNRVAQPITAAPTVTLDNQGIPWVFFGTGRYLTIPDKSSQDIQTWYGLRDNTDINPADITHAQLTQRIFVGVGSIELPDGSNRLIRSIQHQTNAADMNGKRGWYIDFDVPDDLGERVIDTPLIIKAPRGTVLEIPSIIPSTDPCLAGGRGYINFINAFTGAALNFPFIDLNGDGIVNDQDIPPGSKYSFPGSIGIQEKDGMPGNLAIVGDQNIIGSTGGGLTVLKKNLGISKGGQHGRISWRELINE